MHSPHQLVPTVVLQEPGPSSSQSCRRRSSAAQPLKSGRIPRVSWSLYTQFKHPHVALSTEVCELHRLAVLAERLVLVQVDLISSLCDLGNAQEKPLHWANFPDPPAALSLIRSASHRPLASCRGEISLCASEDLSHLRAFSPAFGLSSTPAFALAFLLWLFNGSSCFLWLRPRLADCPRHSVCVPCHWPPVEDSWVH